MRGLFRPHFNYTNGWLTQTIRIVRAAQFRKVGDHYFLTQIWASARDEGLLVPESRQEKELRASNSGTQGGVETVIVALR